MNQSELPKSPDAEKAVIASCIIDASAVNHLKDWLEPEDFYSEKLRLLYQSILDSHDDNFDMTVLLAHLQAHNLTTIVDSDYILDILGDYPGASSNVERLAKEVKNTSDRRKAIYVLRNALKVAYENPDVEVVKDTAESGLLGITTNSSKSEFIDMPNAIRVTVDEITKFRELEKPPGIQTGLTDLDRLIVSLAPGTLNIIAARPSLGKTALVLCIAYHNLIAKNPKNVIFYSLEMKASELMKRMVALDRLPGTPTMGQMQDPRLMSDRQFERFLEALERTRDLPLQINEMPNLSVMDIRARSRRLAAKRDIGLIVIDYLQLISLADNYGGNRTDQIGDVTRKLKILARELNCPIILLSQLNRSVEKRENKRPMLSDLRESGNIEQDADLVAFLYREGYYNRHLGADEENIAEIIIAKQRQGPVGIVEVLWHPERAQFVNLDPNYGRY